MAQASRLLTLQGVGLVTALRIRGLLRENRLRNEVTPRSFLEFRYLPGA